MRLSIKLILVLITCAALRPDLVGAERGEKAAKNRQVGEKGPEEQEKLSRKAPQGESKNKAAAKYKTSASEEDSDESDEEPRKNYKIKQKDVAEKRNKKNVDIGSEEEEKGGAKKGKWNVNYKNHKNSHFQKDGTVKFESVPAGNKNVNRDRKENEDSEEKEEKKLPKASHKKTSVDKEGAKKYLKEKNDKSLKESKKAIKRAQDDDDDDDDSSEESGLKSATKNKQEADLKPFEKVRKSSVVRKQKPKKIEVDESDSDDTDESKNNSDDDSTDTEESDDDDDDSEDKDSLQCDSVEENCD